MDARDREAEFGRSGEGFDESNMTLSITVCNDEDEEYEAVFPAKYITCELCSGKGTHVNPSIDAHGISEREFDEDPDFREEYFAGTYDVSCYRCQGKRVEPVVDEESLSDEQKANLKLYHDRLQADAEFAREVEAERRMGA